MTDSSVPYFDALVAWSSGTGIPLPVLCPHTDPRARCEYTADHPGPCSFRLASPGVRPVWRVNWTDDHGRARVINVSRAACPSPRDALVVLSAAFESQICSVDSVDVAAVA